MTLDQRFDRLLARRAAAEDRDAFRFSARYATRLDGLVDETDRYLASAMAPIDSKYTERLRLQGTRVENQLKDRLGIYYPYLEFRRQGSVSNDTHIRYVSDVDVLAFPGLFVTLQMPQPNPIPYQGSPEDDLLLFRAKARAELALAFPAVVVDDSGSTAIKLSGGSLACSVDVVPSSWYDTLEYARTRDETTRGVQVLNKDTRERVLNFPFTFNHRLDLHDRARSGAARRIIRLVKTLKADLVEDSKPVALSSYDICSFIYRMTGAWLSSDGYGARREATACLVWLTLLLNDRPFRETLQVVDDSRPIFDGPEKTDALRLLHKELFELLDASRASATPRVAAW